MIVTVWYYRASDGVTACTRVIMVLNGIVDIGNCTLNGLVKILVR